MKLLFIQRKVEFDWQGSLPERKWLFPQHFTAINYRFEYEVFLM